MSGRVTTLYAHVKRPALIDAYERLLAYYRKHAIPMPAYRPYSDEVWPDDVTTGFSGAAIGAMLNSLLNNDVFFNTQLGDDAADEWMESHERRRHQQTMRRIFRAAVGHRRANGVHSDLAGVTHLRS